MTKSDWLILLETVICGVGVWLLFILAYTLYETFRQWYDDRE